MSLNSITDSCLQTNSIFKTLFSIKLLIFCLMSLIIIFFKLLTEIFLKKKSIFFTKIFHKSILWLMNIEVIVCGKNIRKNGSLIVSNHLSYIDIPILGSLLPVKFVAKSDMQTWPIIGTFAKIGNTIFIDRSRSKLLEEKKSIQICIGNGDNVILFPEGTTSDGNRVLEFKSSLLSTVENKHFLIQPVVIKYQHINGIPLNRWLKPSIAWYGDMELFGHLKNLINLFSIRVKVFFLDPINPRDFKNRKSMTLFLHSIIYNRYSDIN